jgi:hypothetical protein
MDYDELLGVLPKRSESHVKNDMARLAFRNIIRDPLFIVREETDNDYGVDICIEVLVNNGQSPTNIRSHVQLKSSGKELNKSGDFSYSVSLSNLNYLLNHSCSFYAFYSIEKDKFYYCYAEKVYTQYCSDNKKWDDNKTITVHFTNVLDEENIRLIHHQLLDTTIFFKDIRLNLRKGGIMPGAKFVYGELVFESSDEAFQEYQNEHNISYVYTTDENGKVIFIHNLIWESRHGTIPKGYQVYHVNNNPLDNRSDNLDIMKTVETFDIEGFQKEVEEQQAFNILSLIIEGCEADFKDVPPPPTVMFNRIINELKAQGWYASEEEMMKIKKDLNSYLLMDIK